MGADSAMRVPTDSTFIPQKFQPQILFPFAAAFVSAAAISATMVTISATIIPIVAFVIPVVAIVSLAAVAAIGVIEILFSFAGLNDDCGAIRMVLESFVVATALASVAAMIAVVRFRTDGNLLTGAVIGLVFDFVGRIKDMR